jgi:predicted SAM-dependent methyltransferase
MGTGVYKLAMKLNVGSGYPKKQYLELEWVNIDDAPEGTFLGNDGHRVTKMSALGMPLEWTDKFEEVHCVHVLEHINRNFRQEVVNQLHRVTSPGGVAYIEVPDFQTIILVLAQAFISRDVTLQHNMTTSIYGKQRYAGDQHCWGFTVDTLSDLCLKTGFTAVKVQTPNDANFTPISAHYQQEPILLATCLK